MESNRNIRENIHAKKDDRIVIFGVGNYAKRLCEFYGIDEIKKQVEAFVVTEKNSETFFSCPVKSFEELRNVADRYIIILAVAKDTRKDVEDNIRKKYRRVILLEEFMNMSVFCQEENQHRAEEIENFYEYFKKYMPLFQYIEIETINRCNGTCEFCPVNRNEIQRPYAKMKEELFRKIIDELADLDYRGKVALFSNNEPFIDTRIVELSKYARENLPNAFIYLASNGTLLSADKYIDLYPYIDNLVLDIYKNNLNDPEPENVIKLLRVAKEKGKEDRIHINHINVKAIRSSRGGKSPNSKVDFTIHDKCPLPLVQMVIRPDGKVSLCCNDALGTMNLGDVNKSSLKEIWTSDKYEHYRKKILAGRENVDLCKYCDYVDMRNIKWDC